VLLVEDDDAFAEALSELLAADRRIELVGRAREVREAGADDFLRKGRLDTDLAETVLALAERKRLATRREPIR
jgi:hypothetical protein